MSQWTPYLLPAFDFAEFPRGAHVLDIGCGDGGVLADLHARGCAAVGVDVHLPSLQTCRLTGANVVLGTAEALPLRAASCDGITCKVVLPYTDERRAIAEIARVLRPGGVARLSGHGGGYYLWYLLHGERFGFRLYGLRALVNTVVYRFTGRRLPGFAGDTIAQSDGSLRRAYREVGLELIESHKAPTHLGRPVFIYHVVAKPAPRATPSV